MPGIALRTVLGEFADEGLLGGQRAIPAALERAGFVFHHNTIGEALAYATAPAPGSTVDRVRQSIRSGSAPIEVRHLGTVDYLDAWQLQRELADARVAGGPDTLLLLEHPRSTPRAGAPRPTNVRWTAPRRRHRPGRQDHLARSRTAGGLPVIGMAEPLDVVNYVRRLEESLIDVCGPRLGRRPGRGPLRVWLPANAGRPERKIAAIGIRVARGTTLHGFALNCDCDLTAYTAIVPCGITDAG